MNDLEREVIILNTAWGMIDGMVNWSMFVRQGDVQPTNLMFETEENSRLFAILLADFLSQVGSKKNSDSLVFTQPPADAKPSDLTFLFQLREVVARPEFANDAVAIGASVEEFSCWLERDIVVDDVYLSTINVIANLSVTPYRYLKMCGDIAKHNLARLTVNVRHLRNLLKAAGYVVTEQEACLVIDDFFEKFHGDVFMYQSSYIAELLNNIRLAIFHYLTAEFRRSWHRTKGGSHDRCYGYRTPPAIEDPIAHALYWQLMNRVRARPLMDRFVVPEVLRQRYQHTE